MSDDNVTLFSKQEVILSKAFEASKIKGFENYYQVVCLMGYDRR